MDLLLQNGANTKIPNARGVLALDEKPTTGNHQKATKRAVRVSELFSTEKVLRIFFDEREEERGERRREGAYTAMKEEREKEEEWRCGNKGRARRKGEKESEASEGRIL